ncbi:MAG: LysM peptidoglycan-binding domain-containing protein [Sinimarinibacterium sp.]|jgi:nucleoid-associated protein YgaU
MISHPMTIAVVGACLLAGCGLHRIPATTRPPATPAARPAVRPTPPPTPVAAAPQPRAILGSIDISPLQQARSRYDEARRTLADWPEAGELRALLDDAESAAAAQDAANMRRLSAEVTRRSGDALDAQDLLRAELELQKVQTYTGLSDAQLERLRSAEVALAARQGSRAWTLLRALNQELAEATQRYVVAAGDSLWIISGRPEVYGNSYLWPLIWDANLDTLKDPNQLRSGQRLRIRSNPTVGEVVEAVERARSFRSPTIRIGEIREAGS